MPELKASVSGRATMPEQTGFGVYIHWPFCAAKCPYCDFNSHVRHGGVDQQAYLEAYQEELRYVSRVTGSREVSSIFFGGGTPSLMHPGTVEAILEEIARCWELPADAEITLEANPSSVEAGRFAGYRSAGVNRVSLGVQSLHDDALKFLGRLHSANDALTAVEVAQKSFDRVSIDLIYARPGQTPEEWESELKRAIGLGTTHMSLYQLTIEAGTPFFDLERKGSLRPVEEELAAELFELTQFLMSDAGMEAYEVSNHARSGQECEHNLIYWRAQDYAGIGPGAHGRITTKSGRLATATIRHPETWHQAVGSHKHGFKTWEFLAPQAVADEVLLMGLRLKEGLDLSRAELKSGNAISVGQIEFLEKEALIERVGNARIRTTAKGMLVLNALVETLARS